MGGLNLHVPTLLAAARAVGLAVTEAGGRLTVRGPKGAAALARLLLDRKDAVLAALAPEGTTDHPDARMAPRPSWEALAALRWGPAESDPEPGLAVHSPPGPADLAALPWHEMAADPYAVAEREAIRRAEADRDDPGPVHRVIARCEHCGDPAAGAINRESLDGDCDGHDPRTLPAAALCAACIKFLIAEP